MSRSYRTFRDSQPFNDGWKQASYTGMAPSDHFHRPFVMETEGQQMPIIRYASGSNGESYVIKAEIIEHSVFPAEYRYSWQPVEEFGDYGVDNRYQPRFPDHIIEEIVRKVRNGACRGSTGPVTLPMTTTQGWRSGPNQFLQENNSDDERNSPEFYERLGGNEGYVPKAQPLLKPPEHTKQSNTYAKNGATKPPKTSPQDNTRGGLTGRSMPGPETKVEPKDYYSEPKALPLTSWRNGPNMSGPNTKVEPKDYDSEPKAFPTGNTRSRNGPETKVEPKDYYSEPKAFPTGNTRSRNGPETKVEPTDYYSEPKAFPPGNIRSRNGPQTKVEPTDYYSEPKAFPPGNIRSRNGPETEVEPKDYYSEPKAFPLGTTRWRNGTNMSGPNAKVEWKNYDSEPKALPMPTQRSPNNTNRLSPVIKMEPLDSNSEEEEDEKSTPLGKLDKLKISSDRGGQKPFENKGGYENPKRNAAVVQYGEIAGRKKTPEKIDSKEASRRYGKLPSSSAEEEEYEGTITSRQAMARYRGALVP